MVSYVPMTQYMKFCHALLAPLSLVFSPLKFNSVVTSLIRSTTKNAPHNDIGYHSQYNALRTIPFGIVQSEALGNPPVSSHCQHPGPICM